MGNMSNGMPPTNPFAGMSFNKNQSQAFGSLQAPVDDLSGAKGNPAGSWIGLGAGLSSAIGEMMPTPYNQNIGMEKPNFFKEMLNAQYTGMGAAIGGPWGALVGGIIDTGKNIGSYVNKQAKWNQALQRWENTTEQEQRMQTMQPDYTGYARHGMKAGCTPMYAQGGMVPVEIERNEAVVMPTPYGHELMGVTPPDAPTHEQGGIKTQLPEGALVFPQQYVPQVQQAIQTGDNGMMAQLTQDMLAKSQQAAQQGKPYSSGGLFGNGGKVAQSIQEYDPVADTERTQARNMLSTIMTEYENKNISNDERDLLTMGLLARINPDEPHAMTLKEKYPEHYGYFVGKKGEFKEAKDVPDVIAEREGGMHKGLDENNNSNSYKSLLNSASFGMSNKGTHYKDDMTTPMEQFDPKSFYSYLNGQQAGTTPVDANKPQAPATQAVTGADRTATRMAAMKSGLYADDKGTPLTYWDDKSGKRMFNDYARTTHGFTGDVMAATMAPVFKQNLKAMGVGTPSKEAPKTTPQQPVTNKPATTPATPAYVPKTTPSVNMDALRSAEEAHSKKMLEAYNNKSFGAEVKGSKPAVYTGPSFDPARDSIYLLPRDKSGGVYPQYQGPDAPEQQIQLVPRSSEGGKQPQYVGPNAPQQEIQLVPRSNEGGKQPQYTGNVTTPMYVPPRTEGGGIMQFGTGVKDMESESRTSNERPSYTTPIKEQQNSNTDEQQRNIDYMNDERDYKLATPKLPYKADLKLKGAPGLQNYLNWKLQELHEEQMKREREARNKNR